MSDGLSLAEQVLVVAFEPDRRRVTGGPNVYLGAAGAVIMELLESGAAEVFEGRVRPTGQVPSTPILSAAAAAIAAETRPRDLGHWVRHFAAPRYKLGQQLLESLATRGVLLHRSERVLGLFPVDRQELADPRIRESLVASLRAALLAPDQPPSDLATVIGLLAVSGLVDRVVERPERRAAHARADAIVKASPVDAAVSKVAAQVQAEVMAAIIATTIASTASTSSSQGGGGHGH